ncbi:MAG: M28 family peptidase [Gemmatimonadota bacterium]
MATCPNPSNPPKAPWLGALAFLFLSTACAPASPPEAPAPAPDDLEVVERPISAAAADIRVEELKGWVTAFAHDSVRGRAASSPEHDKAVEFLATELGRMGLQPAGDDGTFFQTVPMIRRSIHSNLTVDGRPLELWEDWAPYDHGAELPSLNGAQVVFGGNLGAGTPLIDAEGARGNFVILGLPEGVGPTLPPVGPGSPLAEAAGVAVTNLDPDFPDLLEFLRSSNLSLDGVEPPFPALPVIAFLSTDQANRLLQTDDYAELPVGHGAGMLQGEFSYSSSQAESRNVVALLEGSDPVLRGELVALGAHSDHTGLAARPLDHDSLRAFNQAEWAIQRELPAGESVSPESQDQISVDMDSLRAILPPRMDSIFNGADDNASGSITLLSVVQAFTRFPVPPRRSILFVWHTAEELGLLGAQHFTDNPPFPLESMVAHINMDMVGRGTADDLPHGGADYLQLIGSRRLSTQLGDLVEAVNGAQAQPFRFDYQFDADGHPENYYCRSDHYMYARYGIPVVFFTTGGHADYHQLTDEVEYLDVEKMAKVGRFVHALTSRLANQDQRPLVDQPIPDPDEPCQQ